MIIIFCYIIIVWLEVFSSMKLPRSWGLLSNILYSCIFNMLLFTRINIIYHHLCVMFSVLKLLHVHSDTVVLDYLLSFHILRYTILSPRQQ